MNYNTKILIEKSEADAILLEQKNEKIAKANETRLSKGQTVKPLLVAEIDDRHSAVENVFPFNYEEHVIYNKDERSETVDAVVKDINGDETYDDDGNVITEQVEQHHEQTLSRYRVIFGNEGQIINCAKNSYHIVPTLAVSSLAEAFENEGLEVKPFIFNDGAKIGLSVTFGNRPSKVGECQYTLIVTVPNDGSGMGYLAVRQLRLICSNGQTRRSTVYKDNNIKIPHTFDYNDAIELMKASIQTYGRLLKELEERDVQMAEVSLTDTQILFHLNKWFYQYEMPASQKKFTNDEGEVVDYTLNMFRAQLVEDADSVPSSLRYKELMEALEREEGYNKDLKLDLSMYTVFATITNYLSRRQEKSGSKAPSEIKSERTSAKLKYFDDIIKELV